MDEFRRWSALGTSKGVVLMSDELLREIRDEVRDQRGELRVVSAKVERIYGELFEGAPGVPGALTRLALLEQSRKPSPPRGMHQVQPTSSPKSIMPERSMDKANLGGAIVALAGAIYGLVEALKGIVQ